MKNLSTIRNAEDLDDIIEDKSVTWNTYYSRRNGLIKFKTSNFEGQKILQTSIKVYGASAFDTCKIFFDQLNKWNKSVS